MIFNPNSRTGDVLKTGSDFYAENAAGAAVVKGTICAFKPSTQKMYACADAATNRLPLAVALENIANGAVGRWSSQGVVYANVANAVNAADTKVMPSTAATGGTTLIAFSAGAGQLAMICGLTIEAGADAVLTKVLFDGLSGRIGGQGAVA